MSGGYKAAMVAAGAVVHEFKSFGSYQGEWYALVTYEGETGWVSGCYGSCSGCDSFEAEFGWDEDEYCEEHRFNADVACQECAEKAEEHQKRLADFGRGYLTPLPIEHFQKPLADAAEWDDESKAIWEWMLVSQEEYNVWTH